MKRVRFLPQDCNEIYKKISQPTLSDKEKHKPNAAAKKRSDAARKANATRRANKARQALGADKEIAVRTQVVWKPKKNKSR